MFRSVCRKVDKVFQSVAWSLVGEERADQNIAALLGELNRGQKMVGARQFEQAAQCLGRAPQTYKNAEHGVVVDLLLEPLSAILKQHSASSREALEPTLKQVKEILGDSCKPGEDVVAALLVASQGGLTRPQKQQLSNLCKAITTGHSGLFERLHAQLSKNQGIVHVLSGETLGMLSRDQDYINKSDLFEGSASWPDTSRKDLQRYFNEEREKIFFDLAHQLQKEGPAAKPKQVDAHCRLASDKLVQLHEKTERIVKLVGAASTLSESIANAHNKSDLFTECAPLPLGCRDNLKQHFNSQREKLQRDLSEALKTEVAAGNVEALGSALKGVKDGLEGLAKQTKSIMASMVAASNDLAQIAQAEAQYQGAFADGTKYLRIRDETAERALIPSAEVSSALERFRDATVGKARREFSAALTGYLTSQQGSLAAVEAAVPALTSSFNRFADAAPKVAVVLRSIADRECIADKQLISTKDILLDSVPDSQKQAVASVFELAAHGIKVEVVAALDRALSDPYDLDQELEAAKWKADIFEGYTLGVVRAPEHERTFAQAHSKIETQLANIFAGLADTQIFSSDSLVTQALRKVAFQATSRFVALCKDKNEDPRALLSEIDELVSDDLLERAKQTLELSSRMKEPNRSAFERAFAESI
jgi:hypothetical protein